MKVKLNQIRLFGYVSILFVCVFESSVWAKAYKQTKQSFPTFASTLERLRNEDASDPILLQQVLDSALGQFPLLEIAKENVKVAEGDVLTSSGIFDPRLSVLPTGVPSGKEQYQYLRSAVDLQTALWGTQFYLGHQVSAGDIPVYDGNLKTPSNGELIFGGNLPLLRNGFTDRGRAALSMNQAKLGSAGTRLQTERIEVARQAQRRYWDWVFQGKRYHILKSLLDIAIRRDSFLETRVRAGDLPLIEQRDNQRAIAQRRIQVVNARRSFERTGLDLSLYFRDQNGIPIVASEERLPPTVPELPKIDFDLKTSVSQAILNRPDLGDFQFQKNEARADLQLAKNDLLPNLDFGVDFERALNVGGGGPFPENEMKVKLKLELPLLFRAGRGRRQSTQTRLDILEVREKYFKDQIEVQVRDAIIAVNAARENIESAREEVRLASQVEDGERRRFEAGESSFILVNLREIATADAANREMEALQQFFSSLADYEAATAQRNQ